MNNMQRSVQHTPEEVATYLVSHYATVRQTAKALHMSKSTVHTYCYLCDDYVIRTLALKQLAYNKSVRSLRGGLATARKYVRGAQENVNG